MVRRMPDSLVTGFGPRLAEMDWSCLEPTMPTDKIVEKSEAAALQLVNEHFPQKQVTIIEGDQPYFTEELRQLRRQRDRAYERGGKSPTYLSLQNKFKVKLNSEAAKYRNKIIKEVNEGKRGSGYKPIRKLGESQA